ncbi:hypothetical protein ACFSTD_08040 [Novosphingobium colocasiae]
MPSGAGGSGAVRPEILFLSHRIPFPPDRGDKIRSFNVLQALARLGPVHVATFADDADDMAHERALAGLAASHCLLPRTKSLARSGMEALITAKPISLAAFRDARLSRYIAEVLRTRPIAAIYLFSGQMGQYLPPHFDGRIVADLVDVDSAKFEAYAAKKRGAFAAGWNSARRACWPLRKRASRALPITRCSSARRRRHCFADGSTRRPRRAGSRRWATASTARCSMRKKMCCPNRALPAMTGRA